MRNNIINAKKLLITIKADNYNAITIKNKINEVFGYNVAYTIIVNGDGLASLLLKRDLLFSVIVIGIKPFTLNTDHWEKMYDSFGDDNIKLTSLVDLKPILTALSPMTNKFIYDCLNFKELDNDPIDLEIINDIRLDVKEYKLILWENYSLDISYKEYFDKLSLILNKRYSIKLPSILLMFIWYMGFMMYSVIDKTFISQLEMDKSYWLTYIYHIFADIINQTQMYYESWINWGSATIDEFKRIINDKFINWGLTESVQIDESDHLSSVNDPKPNNNVLYFIGGSVLFVVGLLGYLWFSGGSVGGCYHPFVDAVNNNPECLSGQGAATTDTNHVIVDTLNKLKACNQDLLNNLDYTAQQLDDAQLLRDKVGSFKDNYIETFRSMSSYGTDQD